MPSLKLLSLILSCSLIAACGGGGGGGDSSSTPSGGSGTGGGGTPPSSSSAKTLSLSWVSPSTREDGSAIPISELSGYEVYYYLDGSPNGDTVVPVSGGSTNTTKITLNTTGTYYFAIAAIDSEGLVSNLSNYVSVSIN